MPPALLKRKAVVDTSEAVETYAAEPRPATVEVRLRLSVDVETWPNKLGAEIKPAVWYPICRPWVVDTREAVLTYKRPRPVTVDCKVVFSRVVDTWPNKLGAEIKPAVWYPVWSAATVDISEVVDT